jgi:hypothetical protein
LQGRGATFILCFLDVNAISRWDINVSEAEGLRDYAFLLRWALEDSSLGLIIKPKRPETLQRRLLPLADLVRRVEATGRCQILRDEALAGLLPAEAALSADLCVGKLIGATAAFEARAAGVPTVLVDTDGFPEHPFYQWGRGRVVFPGWDGLREAVEAVRCAGGTDGALGDWSPGWAALDPFRDGRGTERLGHVIGSLHAALARGATAAEALRDTVAQYAARWDPAVPAASPGVAEPVLSP